MAMSLEEKVNFIYSTVLALAKKEGLLSLDKILMAEYELTEQNINDVVQQLEELVKRHARGEKMEYAEFQRTVRSAGYSAKQIIGILYAGGLYTDLIDTLGSTPPEVEKIIANIKSALKTGQ